MARPVRKSDGSPYLRHETQNLTLVPADLGGDGGDHFVELSDYGPTGLSDHVGFGVGVDSQDILAAHGHSDIPWTAVGRKQSATTKRPNFVARSAGI